jgi:hypothetical protein
MASRIDIAFPVARSHLDCRAGIGDQSSNSTPRISFIIIIAAMPTIPEAMTRHAGDDGSRADAVLRADRADPGCVGGSLAGMAVMIASQVGAAQWS